MTNPFEKRATEYLNDDSAFLSVVTPEPLHTFFEQHAESDSLYDRLCVVVGTPGSGKTTIATLMQYQTIHTLINSPNHTEYATLYDALARCKMVIKNQISIVSTRIPMESEYRDFWELPYPTDVKFGLLKSFLQARTMISWLRDLERKGNYDLDKTYIEYRDGAVGAQDSLGGRIASQVLERANKIEKAIYKISASLVAPAQSELPEIAVAPYQPFDCIIEFSVHEEANVETRSLRPLVVLDDVHTLHPEQLILLRDWLAKREMRISRWMLMRLDAQTPEAVLDGILNPGNLEAASTIQNSREITQIWLQNNEGRAANRRSFRTMAKSMANKYLRLMHIFQSHGLTSFQNLLNSKPETISTSNLQKLKTKVDSLQQNSHIGPDIRSKLEGEVLRYLSGLTEFQNTDDMKSSMLLILMNRYLKRIPQSDLFREEIPLEPNRPIKADASVADGAKIFLLHEYNRPYYYGIDAICDGSSENAEQFLHLAGRLVNAAETRLIRGSPAELPPNYQQRLLQEKAEQIISEWVFPRHADVRKLCNYIADQCLEKSLEPNASLGGGANAFGIPIEQFERITKEHTDLAQVLKFAVAYSAISIKRNHKTKHRVWTLIELTGPTLISRGLTFARGGFLERKLSDLTANYRDE